MSEDLADTILDNTVLVVLAVVVATAFRRARGGIGVADVAHQRPVGVRVR